MNRHAFIENLANHLNGLQGKIDIREDYIFISSLVGNTSQLLSWLDTVASFKRYTITETKLISDMSLANFVWECNGGMFYTVTLDNITYIHVNICNINKILPQSAVNITADI